MMGFFRAWWSETESSTSSLSSLRFNSSTSSSKIVVRDAGQHQESMYKESIIGMAVENLCQDDNKDTGVSGASGGGLSCARTARPAAAAADDDLILVDDDDDDGVITGENVIRRITSDYSIAQRSHKKSAVCFTREHTFLGRDPMLMTCPNCLCAVETTIERRNTIKTHLSALLLVPVCLCVLPYYSKVLRNTIHRCPACGIHLGNNFASATEAFSPCHRRRNRERDEQNVCV